MDPLIGSGLNSLLNIGGGIHQNTANQMAATRQYDRNQTMWERQRDNDLANWNRANAYNSPQSQMARFKEAGLNPHLIYGKGSSGNTTAMRSPDIKPYNRAEAKNVMQGQNAFGDYVTLKNTEAQTNLLEEQENVARNTAALKNTENARQIIQFANEAKYSFETAKETLRGLEATSDHKRADADVAMGTKENRIEQAGQNLANSIKDGDLKTQQKAINQFEIDLNSQGLTKNDNKFWRILATHFGSMDALLKATAGVLSIPPELIKFIKTLFMATKFID